MELGNLLSTNVSYLRSLEGDCDASLGPIDPQDYRVTALVDKVSQIHEYICMKHLKIQCLL